MNNPNIDDFDMTKDKCTRHYNYLKTTIKLSGTDLVKNIRTIYVNTQYITEENTIHSTS